MSGSAGFGDAAVVVGFFLFLSDDVETVGAGESSSAGKSSRRREEVCAAPVRS